MYHEGSRKLQDEFDTRRMADRINDVLVTDNLSNYRDLIESSDMFFLATADDKGQSTCSYKGGDPGFVKVIDEHTLAFPNYDGNGMYLSMGNLLKNPRVGLLFIDFEEGNRLRVEGVKRLSLNGSGSTGRKTPFPQTILQDQKMNQTNSRGTDVVI